MRRQKASSLLSARNISAFFYLLYKHPNHTTDRIYCQENQKKTNRLDFSRRRDPKKNAVRRFLLMMLGIANGNFAWTGRQSEFSFGVSHRTAGREHTKSNVLCPIYPFRKTNGIGHIKKKGLYFTVLFSFFLKV